MTDLLRIGDDLVAMHAIVARDGVTLVDAGLSGDKRRLTSALAGVGRSPADIRGVILTHGDPDHLGVAEWLRRTYGVPIYVHAADAERAKGMERSSSTVGPWKVWPTLQFFGSALVRGGMRTRHPREVVTLVGNEHLDLPGAPEVIAIPGHSPGSVAIRVPEVDALFVGDALTTRNVLTGTAGPASAPFSDDAELSRWSLDVLAGFPESTIVPGHGPIYRGTIRDLIDEMAG